jgi:Cu/Ag efflux pump CusA
MMDTPANSSLGSPLDSISVSGRSWRSTTGVAPLFSCEVYERHLEPKHRTQQVLSGMPETKSVFAERVSQGFYLNVEANRTEAARNGLTASHVQRVINSEIWPASCGSIQ